MPSELRIHTKIHSRYQVFDASGQLPFSIVFGLCRRSPADTDTRPLNLDVAGSVIDVPYALAHGLLTLHERDPEDVTHWIEVDLKRLDKVVAKEAERLSLPSPVNRTESWREAFTVYRYHVDVTGELASILEVGKKYTIRLAGADLGVKRWAYSDRNQFANDDRKLSHASEAVKLVNSKPSAGNATFTVVKNLPWPPRLETTMRLCASYDSTPTNDSPSASPLLEISVTNTGSEPITVQTRGHQRFLLPWGPFQPESDTLDSCARIIDTSPHKRSLSSLQLVDTTTGDVVREYKQRGVCGLVDSNADRRPKVEDLVGLKPGEAVVRRVDIGEMVEGLEDGLYKVKMLPTGCRWWDGEVGMEVGGDGRVPKWLCGVVTVPLVIESLDEVEICIRGGKVDQSL